MENVSFNRPQLVMFTHLIDRELLLVVDELVFNFGVLGRIEIRGDNLGDFSSGLRVLFQRGFVQDLILQTLII